jgi:hypothetical protein
MKFYKVMSVSGSAVSSSTINLTDHDSCGRGRMCGRYTKQCERGREQGFEPARGPRRRGGRGLGMWDVHWVDVLNSK